MITLYQHPVSPFCITTEAILKFSKARHRVVNLPYSDRRAVVQKSRGRSYRIPLIEDGKTAVWDKTELGQEVARYLDAKFKLGLFPAEREGLQAILARYIESEVEAIGFKLNDIHYESWLPDPYDRAMFLRHKERKFGPGCMTQWKNQRGDLRRQLDERLAPLDQIVSRQPFPGPGLAIRVIGPVDEESLAVLRGADTVVQEEIRSAGLEDAFLALTTADRPAVGAA